MKKALRQFVHFIFHRLSKISESVEEEKRLAGINKMATIGPDTKIAYPARFINHRKDKTKITIGSNCLLRGEIMLAKHDGEVSIGNYVFLGEHSKIWSAAKIQIGNYVLISHNVNIHDHDSHPLDYKLRKEQTELVLDHNTLSDHDYSVSQRPIIIEDHAWICFNAVILKGVIIGKGAVVAASAVVTENVPPFTVVAGNPAKVIKHLNPAS